MQDTLIDQGINLMLFGMGTVFVFLTILVFATTIMSKLVHRFSPEEQAAESNTTSTPQAVSQTAPQAASPQVISAIEKAIAQHRQR